MILSFLMIVSTAGLGHGISSPTRAAGTHLADLLPITRMSLASPLMRGGGDRCPIPGRKLTREYKPTAVCDELLGFRTTAEGAESSYFIVRRLLAMNKADDPKIAAAIAEERR